MYLMSSLPQANQEQLPPDHYRAASDYELKNNMERLENETCSANLLTKMAGYDRETLTVKHGPVPGEVTEAKQIADMMQGEYGWKYGQVKLKQGKQAFAAQPRTIYGGINGKPTWEIQTAYPHVVSDKEGHDALQEQSNAILLLGALDKTEWDYVKNSCPAIAKLDNHIKCWIKHAKGPEVTLVSVQLLRAAEVDGLQYHSDNADYELPLDFAVSYLLSGAGKTLRVAGAEEEAVFDEVGIAHMFDPAMYHRSGDMLKDDALQATFFYVKKGDNEKALKAKVCCPDAL